MPFVFSPLILLNAAQLFLTNICNNCRTTCSEISRIYSNDF